MLSAHGVLAPGGADLHAHAVFAPDTPADYVAAHRDETAAAETNPQPLASGWDPVRQFDAFTFYDSNRWDSTASDGTYLGQGDPTTLTWSIVPDGTAVDGFNGEPDSPSDLQQYLSALYGSFEAGVSIFSNMFQRWDSLSGIDFVHEPQDDGSPWTNGYIASGETGVRGDIRIAGHTIDGPGGVLAYNFYPDAGDMVIDTADLAPGGYLSDTSDDSLRFRNTLAHEVGHGIGIQHVVPVDQTKLMEPYISTAYDGPQFDDILAAHRGYGDRYEVAGGDTIAAAVDLGSIATSPRTIGGDATDPQVLPGDADFLSIDDDADADFFRFTVEAGQEASFYLSPVGPIYDSGSSSSTVASFDAQSQSDLNLALFGADGSTLLDYANATAAGGSETVRHTFTTAGDYYLRVRGAHNAAQFYQLSAVSADSVAVVDSEDSAGVQLQGDWSGSTAVSGYHGTGYKHNNNSQLGTSSVSFQPEVSSPGIYEVSLKWTSAANRATQVPVTVASKAGTDTFVVNQTRNGGVWYSLGQFEFDTQSGATVTVSDSGADGYVIADAVRLVQIEQTGPPTAALASPESDAVAVESSINDDGFLDVTFAAYGEADLDPASVTDAAAELQLLGTAAENVVVDGAAQLVSGTTYRYFFSGSFSSGDVAVRFVADTFADTAGLSNEENTVNFSVSSSIQEHLLVDSEDASATEMTGSWIDSTSVSGFHGTGYLHDGASSAGKSLTFRPTVAESGHYEVYALWTSEQNRASNVPVDIGHSNGTSTLVVDQRTGGSRWNLLGTFPFAAGTDGTVTLRNSGADGYVIADAVQLVAVAQHGEPSAALSHPTGGTAIDATVLNTGQFIDVTFDADGGNALDASSITDAAAEWQLSGTAAADVVVDGAGQLVSGTTYRYAFSGSFAAGEVTVDFLADSFSDISGLTNLSVSETFTVNLSQEIVLDSEDASVSSRTGNWSGSTSVSGFEGTGYLHDGATAGGKAVSYEFAVAASGYYEVYANWTSEGNRASNVPIDIQHNSGTSTVVVNQRHRGSQWNLLGTFEFQEGSSGAVVMRNEGANGYVIADAVRLVSADPPEAPSASLAEPSSGGAVDAVTINSQQYIDVTFASHGGNALDAASVTDAAAEFELVGDAAAGVTVDGAGQRVSDATYRYPLSGDFLVGDVTVNFLADTFTDSSGLANAAASEVFTVTEPQDFVLDSEDSSVSSRTGTWSTSTVASGFEGAGYLHDNATSGSKAVAFHPSMSQTAEYEVYAIWTSRPNRASNVPIDIGHSGGTTTVVVDQRQGGGRWNLLGTFTFDAGSAAEVKIRNDGADGYVIADAVRFIKQQASGSAASASESLQQPAAAVRIQSGVEPLANSSAHSPADWRHRDGSEEADGQRVDLAAVTLERRAAGPNQGDMDLAPNFTTPQQYQQAIDAFHRSSEEEVSDRAERTLELLDLAFAQLA